MKKSGSKSQVKKPVGPKKAAPRGRHGNTSKNPKGRYSGGGSTVKVPC